MVFVEVLIWFCRGFDPISVILKKLSTILLGVDYLFVGEGVFWGEKWGF
jgi:hypothetical protein